MAVLTDLRNRGVQYTFFVVCDGLKGLSKVAGNVWPQAIVQIGVIRLLSNTFRLTDRMCWDEIKRDVKPIYPAVNVPRPARHLTSWPRNWGQRYPAVTRLWDDAWNEFIPFLDYDVEIRRVICSGECDQVAQCPLPPRDQAPRALPVRVRRPQVPLFDDSIPSRPTGVGRARWTIQWKPALNAFAITFGERFGQPKPTDEVRWKHR